MKNKKLISILLILFVSTGVLITGCDSKTSDGNSKKSVKKEDVSNTKKTNIKYSKKYLEKLDLKQLIQLRSDLIDKNLKRGATSLVKERKKYILDPKWDSGLVSVVNKRCKNLFEKEKLIKEIEIIDFVENNINGLMDPDGEFFNVIYVKHEMSNFLVSKGRTWKYSRHEDVKYMVNHLNELCDYVYGCSIEDILNNVSPESHELLELTVKLAKEGKYKPEIKKEVLKKYKDYVKDGTTKESDLIDALAVGSLAAKVHSPILEVNSKALSSSQKSVVQKKDFDTITQVGGNGNEKAFEQLKDMFK